MNDETQLNDKLNNALNLEINAISGQQAERLRAARMAALETPHTTGAFGSHPLWWSAGVTAAIVLAASAFLLPQHFGNNSINDEINIISADDELELYQDLDFIEWLETRQEPVNAA